MVINTGMIQNIVPKKVIDKMCEASDCISVMRIARLALTFIGVLA